MSSSEARADQAARLARSGGNPFPVRPDSRGGSAPPPGEPRLDGKFGLPRATPASRARKGPGPPRRAPHRPSDPVPGVEWPQIRQVAEVVHEVLADPGLQGWPKTSGSRGLHVLVRIQPQWIFDEVRREHCTNRCRTTLTAGNGPEFLVSSNRFCPVARVTPIGGGPNPACAHSAILLTFAHRRRRCKPKVRALHRLTYGREVRPLRRPPG